MNCPQCNKEFHCGCKSCIPTNEALGRVGSKPDGDYDTCGHCGLRMHVDQWLDVEAKSYDEWKKANPTQTA